MNIHHFESKIDKEVLARGYNYYIVGDILEVTSYARNEYLFEVEGSELYEVEIKIDENGNILRSECDCPYSYGPICKHEVAAYYELQSIINGESNSEIVQREVVKQTDITEFLNGLSKANLIEIIAEIVQQDTVLKNSLIFKYSQGSGAEELDKCKKLIASIVKQYTGKRGFIEYRETNEFSREMMVVLEKADELNNIILAVDIACLVLEEAVEAFQYADDSDGDIGWLAAESLELIDQTIAGNAELEPDIREQLFHKLLGQSDNTVFDGWEDYIVALFGICAYFADDDGLRNTLKVKIEDTVRTWTGQNYQNYSIEALHGIWLGVIQNYGTQEEEEQYIVDNLHYSSFRESLINKYMEKKNYDRVVELTIEGEQQDQSYAGLVLKWQEIRYAPYRELQCKEEQTKLAEKLLFAGKFEYYSELQQLSGADQEALYERLKMKLKKEGGWSARSMYVRLIADANDLDEMIEYVTYNPGVIEEYAGRLVGKFKDEVNAIYSDLIRKNARSATKRKGYEDVCNMLRRYEKIAGSANQAVVVNELRELYRKKPAFMDELNRFE